MTTFYVCSKCGKTAEADEARRRWLIHQRAGEPQGHLVIRCPEHITEYARRLAGLPQQIRTKRIADNIDRGLWHEYGHPDDEYTASAWYDLGAAASYPDEFDDPDLGAYVLQFHKADLPPFHAERFHTISGLIVAMREVEPDLRKWRLC